MVWKNIFLLLLILGLVLLGCVPPTPKPLFYPRARIKKKKQKNTAVLISNNKKNNRRRFNIYYYLLLLIMRCN